MNIWILLHNLSVHMLGYDPAVKQMMAWQIFEHQSSTDRISKMKLKELIREQISFTAAEELDGSDSNYKLVDLEHFKKWIALNPTDQREYVPTRHDCDDFADILMGDVAEWDSDLAFGTIWVERPEDRHAINWLVDTDLHIWMVEPQSDRIFKMPGEWKLFGHIKM